MPSIPLVYYPTTLCWVDDDPLLVKALSHAIISDLHPKIFSTPKACLAHLKAQAPLLTALPLFKTYQDHDEYDRSHQLPVGADLLTLSSLKNHPHRFEEVSVLIADYHMPTMTGIELCHELKGCPIKKILLTGEADHALAVRAFNENVIDCFVRKDDPNLVQTLQSFIQSLSQQYFRSLTHPLLTHLLEVEHKIALTDPTFISFFQEWCKADDIKEYYLIDKNSSFLVLDATGNSRYFIVHTDRTLNAFAELHNDPEVKAFVKTIKAREKIPFFGPGKESWQFEPKDWFAHFHSAHVLQGREKYYWAVVGK